MSLQALIFGGIGTLVETSELQRRAFNQAFALGGLSWQWDVQTYQALLAVPGGKNRIAAFGVQSGQQLDEEQITALHQHKTKLFQESLQAGNLELRPGVWRLLTECKEAGLKVAMASTTSLDNIQQLAAAVELDLDQFDALFHRALVDYPKPNAQVYRKCLRALDITSAQALAIEDSDSGLESAVKAGIVCLVTPGQYTVGGDFARAAAVVDSLGDPSNPANSLRAGDDRFAGQVTLPKLRSLITG